MGDTAFLARAKAGPVSGLQARMAHWMYLAHPQKRKWRPAEEAEAVRLKNWEERENRRGTTRDILVFLKKLLKWTVSSKNDHGVPPTPHSSALWLSHSTIKKWGHDLPLCIWVGLVTHLQPKERSTSDTDDFWDSSEDTLQPLSLWRPALSMFLPAHSLWEVSCHAMRSSSHMEFYVEALWVTGSTELRPETRYEWKSLQMNFCF